MEIPEQENERIRGMFPCLLPHVQGAQDPTQESPDHLLQWQPPLLTWHLGQGQIAKNACRQRSYLKSSFDLKKELDLLKII